MRVRPPGGWNLGLEQIGSETSLNPSRDSCRASQPERVPLRPPPPGPRVPHRQREGESGSTEGGAGDTLRTASPVRPLSERRAQGAGQDSQDFCLPGLLALPARRLKSAAGPQAALVGVRAGGVRSQRGCAVTSVICCWTSRRPGTQPRKEPFHHLQCGVWVSGTNGLAGSCPGWAGI